MIARVLGLSALSVVAAALPLGASAQSEGRGPPPLSWHCVQEFDEHANVACIARVRSDSSADVAPETAAMPAAFPRRGGVDLRPVAQRGDAAVFSFEAWRVPLLVPPVDLEHVELLLRSVLCGRRPACMVSYLVPERASDMRAAAR